MKTDGFSGNRRFIDLNSAKHRVHTLATLRKGTADEFRKNHLRPTDGLSSHLRIPQVRRTLSGTLQGPELFLLGSISLLGLRSTHLPGKPARHRNLPARCGEQALSLGLSQPGCAQHLGQCQRRARLAHLRRLRAGADRRSETALRGRGLWPGIEADRPICAWRSFPGPNSASARAR